MCALKLLTYSIYMDLEAGGSYSGLQGLQGGRGNQGGWELVLFP